MERLVIMQFYISQKKCHLIIYSKEYEKGLELYSNGVLIMNKCADLTS